jgi:DNA-binding PadR family transcriptional regulator
MTVRHALLALLSTGPKYGLQLAQEFEQETGELWPLNTGQVYSTLQRLERDGLVDAEDETRGPQQKYRLTDAGRDDLDAWLRTPPDTTNPPRDELVMKVLVSLRIPGVDTADLVQGYRRHVIESMQQYTRLKEHAAETDVGLLLVADAELFRLEAVVRWLDTADARIRRLPAQVDTIAPERRTAAQRRVGARR